MNDHPTDGAALLCSDALTDLHELVRHLAAGLPADDLELERTAKILDRLSEQLAEAASAVRGRQP